MRLARYPQYLVDAIDTNGEVYHGTAPKLGEARSMAAAMRQEIEALGTQLDRLDIWGCNAEYERVTEDPVISFPCGG